MQTIQWEHSWTVLLLILKYLLAFGIMAGIAWFWYAVREAYRKKTLIEEINEAGKRRRYR